MDILWTVLFFSLLFLPRFLFFFFLLFFLFFSLHRLGMTFTMPRCIPDTNFGISRHANAYDDEIAVEALGKESVATERSNYHTAQELTRRLFMNFHLSNTDQ